MKDVSELWTVILPQGSLWKKQSMNIVVVEDNAINHETVRWKTGLCSVSKVRRCQRNYICIYKAIPDDINLV